MRWEASLFNEFSNVKTPNLKYYLTAELGSQYRPMRCRPLGIPTNQNPDEPEIIATIDSMVEEQMISRTKYSSAIRVYRFG
jgi:hypothetical protein